MSNRVILFPFQGTVIQQLLVAMEIIRMQVQLGYILELQEYGRNKGQSLLVLVQLVMRNKVILLHFHEMVIQQLLEEREIIILMEQLGFILAQEEFGINKEVS